MTCPLCLEAVEQVPYERRTQQNFPIPCEIHGNPAILYPENEIAFLIYGHLYPGNMAIIEMQHGEHVKRELFLRIEPIKMLCDAYDVDLLETLQKLEIIHKEWMT